MINASSTSFQSLLLDFYARRFRRFHGFVLIATDLPSEAKPFGLTISQKADAIPRLFSSARIPSPTAKRKGVIREINNICVISDICERLKVERQSH